MRDQILLINKPLGWTSFDAVKKVKGILIRRMKAEQGHDERINLKVGHAGTLDPLATGLLVICTGSNTKKIQEIQDAEKEYTGTFVLGATTASFDLETEPENSRDYSKIGEEDILRAAQELSGKLAQVPPMHSAIKIDGKRAYSHARKGEEKELKAREIEIRQFDICGSALPEVHFRIVCSKGTYIRSIARDFGTILGCGAYLKTLCRTRIGSYTLENSVGPEDV